MCDKTKHANTTHLYIKVNGKKCRSDTDKEEINDMEDSCEESPVM